MHQTNANKMLRDEITDATAAAFAGSTVIPDRYIQSHEIVRVAIDVDVESCKIFLPVIDMARLLDESQEEISKLGSACRDWGFFQVINHGVDEKIVEHMKDTTSEFFKLPLEKKKAVGTIRADGGLQGFGHHFNTTNGKLDWAESLVLSGVQPILERNMDFWPTDPPTFSCSATTRPLPGSFTIIVGDILEVLTNGRYKSVEHRALVHPERGRTTIVTFQDACVNGVLRPLPELGEDARYMSIEKDDYRQRKLQALQDRVGFMDSLKI